MSKSSELADSPTAMGWIRGSASQLEGAKKMLTGRIRGIRVRLCFRPTFTRQNVLTWEQKFSPERVCQCAGVLLRPGRQESSREYLIRL